MMLPDDPRHGTTNGYSNQECRCDKCKNAWSTFGRERRAQRRQLIAEQPDAVEHGNYTTYLNYGCRCPKCTEAHTHRCRQYRAKARAERSGR